MNFSKFGHSIALKISKYLENYINFPGRIVTSWSNGLDFEKSLNYHPKFDKFCPLKNPGFFRRLLESSASELITLRDRALRVMVQGVPTTQHMRQHGKFDNFRCPGAPETHFRTQFSNFLNFLKFQFFSSFWGPKSQFSLFLMFWRSWKL